MGIRRLVTIVVSVAAVGLLGFSIFRAITAGPADVPRQHELENARRQAAAPGPGADFRQPVGTTSVISGQGIVEPADREVKVGSRVPGLVQKIWVQEGDQVAEGAPLLELASGAEVAAVSAARADLEGAIARSSISSLTAKRAEDLAKDGLVSRDERDRTVSQANIDRAGVNQARSRLSEAQARLAQLHIKAPSAGTILKLSVRAGEYYSPEGGASLVSLGNLSKVRVRLDIDERFIASVFVGQPGYVVVEAYDRKFAGKVVEIAQRMGRKNQRTDDPTERIDTKIREVVLELEDAGDLVPGLRAIGHLSKTKLETSSEVGIARKRAAPPADGRAAVKAPQGSAAPPPPRVGGDALEASASVTTAPRPATAEEWDRWGAALLKAGKEREAVAVYREAVMAHPNLRTRVKDLVGQYRNGNPELAYCLDPSDTTLVAAWAKGVGERRSLCAETR
jgi:multidrug efflux pump subunit AcrA (membrane-fusion protein)